METNKPIEATKTIEATNQLDFRFCGESEIQHIQASQQEIEALIEDFNWYEINKIFNHPYCKRHGIKGIKPAKDSFSYQIIWPVKPHIDLPKEPEKPLNLKLHPTRKILNKSFDLMRHSKNREHEACFIHLHNETTVTCLETGISFSVKLPVPDKLNLEIVHPLAFFSNVQEIVRTYIKQGIKLESELSHQVLAGMLITIWKHKKLLVCRDYVQGNICLQKANLGTLSYAIRFFNSLPSSIGLPQLHLVPEAIYDFHHAPANLTKEQIIADRVEIMLQNFIKVCKGESESETRIAGTILKTKQDKQKIRIYGGNDTIESKQANIRRKLGFKLLEHLKHEFPIPQVSQFFFDTIENKLEAFSFLGTEKRTELAKQILDMFGESKHGRELANLFKETKTETVEMGLETFSHSLEKELGEWKGQKRKFNLFTQTIKKDQE